MHKCKRNNICLVFRVLVSLEICLHPLGLILNFVSSEHNQWQNEYHCFACKHLKRNCIISPVKKVIINNLIPSCDCKGISLCTFILRINCKVTLIGLARRSTYHWTMALSDRNKLSGRTSSSHVRWLIRGLRFGYIVFLLLLFKSGVISTLYWKLDFTKFR